MTQRPILMSTPMVQSTLQGRKTMTRRIIKPQPTEEGWLQAKQGITSNTTHEVYTSTNYKVDTLFNSMCLQFQGKLGTVSAFHQPNIKCPYGNVGDVLWVRETWWKGETWLESDEANTRKETILYRADTTDARPCDLSDEWCINEYGCDKRDWPSWKPSIHMPKAASRLFLRITDVRVERLWDISEEDAIAEGIEHIEQNESFRDYLNRTDWFGSPISSFQSLWQKINGEESWNSNPWVWVIEFERTAKPS